MTGYTPPQPGDRVDGMEWTGVAWAVVCPADDLPLTDYGPLGDLCCPRCGVTDRELVRRGVR